VCWLAVCVAWKTKLPLDKINMTIDVEVWKY